MHGVVCTLVRDGEGENVGEDHGALTHRRHDGVGRVTRSESDDGDGGESHDCAAIISSTVGGGGKRCIAGHDHDAAVIVEVPLGCRFEVRRAFRRTSPLASAFTPVCSFTIILRARARARSLFLFA